MLLSLCIASVTGAWHAEGQSLKSKVLPQRSVPVMRSSSGFPQKLGGYIVIEWELVLTRLDETQRMLFTTVFQWIFARPHVYRPIRFLATHTALSVAHNSVSVSVLVLGESAPPFLRELRGRGLSVCGTLKHGKITACITMCILLRGSKTDSQCSAAPSGGNKY